MTQNHDLLYWSTTWYTVHSELSAMFSY